MTNLNYGVQNLSECEADNFEEVYENITNSVSNPQLFQDKAVDCGNFICNLVNAGCGNLNNYNDNSTRLCEVYAGVDKSKTKVLNVADFVCDNLKNNAIIENMENCLNSTQVVKENKNCGLQSGLGLLCGAKSDEKSLSVANDKQNLASFVTESALGRSDTEYLSPIEQMNRLINAENEKLGQKTVQNVEKLAEHNASECTINDTTENIIQFRTVGDDGRDCDDEGLAVGSVEESSAGAERMAEESSARGMNLTEEGLAGGSIEENLMEVDGSIAESSFEESSAAVESSVDVCLADNKNILKVDDGAVVDSDFYCDSDVDCSDTELQQIIDEAGGVAGINSKFEVVQSEAVENLKSQEVIVGEDNGGLAVVDSEKFQEVVKIDSAKVDELFQSLKKPYKCELLNMDLERWNVKNWGVVNWVKFFLKSVKSVSFTIRYYDRLFDRHAKNSFYSEHIAKFGSIENFFESLAELIERKQKMLELRGFVKRLYKELSDLEILIVDKFVFGADNVDEITKQVSLRTMYRKADKIIPKLVDFMQARGYSPNWCYKKFGSIVG